MDGTSRWKVHERISDDALGVPILTQEIVDPETSERFSRAAWAEADNLEVSTWVDLIRIGRAAVVNQEVPILRRAARVLAMVAELHKVGFQKLRIAPGMSGSGMYWRCTVLPRNAVLRKHGAYPVDWDSLGANYTSGSDNEFFGWTDAKADTARALAKKFLERFPQIADAGRGRDWEYAGWYAEMLGAAEKGALPVAYADYLEHDREWLATTGEVRIPMPPPGEAEPREDMFPDWN